jgi:hypothetical protein
MHQLSSVSSDLKRQLDFCVLKLGSIIKVADALRVSRQTPPRWLCGKACPSYRVGLRLAALTCQLERQIEVKNTSRQNKKFISSDKILGGKEKCTKTK